MMRNGHSQHSPCLGRVSDQKAGSKLVESGTMKPGQGANLTQSCQLLKLF